MGWIEVWVKLNQYEKWEAIIDAASLKDKIKAFSKKLSVLENQKQDLSGLNMLAKE